jgi:type II secretory pathway component GspD/PulD (secretin)
MLVRIAILVLAACAAAVPTALAQGAAGQKAGVSEYQMTGDEYPAVVMFHLAHATSSDAMRELTNAIRTAGDINHVYPLDPAQTILVRGTNDQAAMAKWLVALLDVPAPVQPASEGATREFQLGGVKDPVVRVFFLQHTDSPEAIQEVVNSVRVVADLNRVMPVNAPMAIVARGTADQVGVAGWLVHDLDRAPTPQLVVSARRVPYGTRGDTEARVFHLAHIQSPRAVQETLNAIRSTADINRAMTCASARAIAMRGTPEQMGLVEKLIAELDKP